MRNQEFPVIVLTKYLFNLYLIIFKKRKKKLEI
jgi:hypothetical protein